MTPTAVHLRRRPEPARTAALFLASADAGHLVALCGRLGTDPLPRVAPVADGFVVWLDADLADAPPRTVRLRRLAENLLVPADAELVPALHPDEAAALTRDRGLLVLPGGRVLAFDAHATFSPAALLRSPTVRRGDWEPLPEGPRLADRLNAIHRLQPPGQPPEAVLGSEDPGPAERPPGAEPEKEKERPRGGLGSSLAGRASIGAGKILAKLGQALGLKRLARMGGDLIGRGLALAPRLTEQVLGRQRAAIEDLLRNFREGRIDDALRKAIPFGDEGGSNPYTGTQLPDQDPRYGLGGLLGSGRGRGVYFMTPEDLRQELYREYRRVAQEALDRGDYRRAAYIYGRLLRDLALAADVLARGGLHHDAGVLYRDKLGKPLLAAREFEAAGEFDEALRLYRQHAAHEKAGDLLKRLGDDDAAREEYLAAAQHLAATQGCRAAGELLLAKVGRGPLVTAYFRLGWERRRDRGPDTWTIVSVNGREEEAEPPPPSPTDAANSVPCAARLAWIYATDEDPGPLLSLAEEADEFLRPSGKRAEAGEFFNTLVELSELPNVAPLKAELRDRALRGLAHHLRSYAAVESRPGTVVSTLLGSSDRWPPAVVSDAAFALKAGMRREEPGPTRAAGEVRVGSGTVTAAGFAPETGDVFVGFEHGEVACFRPTTGDVLRVAVEPWKPVRGLACDERGELVVLLQRDGSKVRFRSYARRSRRHYQYHGERELLHQTDPDGTRLLPLIAAGREGRTRYATFAHLDGRLTAFTGPLLFPVALAHGDAAEGVDHHLYLPLMGGKRMVLQAREADFGDLGRVQLPWMPGAAEGAAVESPPLSWLHQHARRVELAGVTDQGVLYWTALARPAEGVPDVFAHEKTFQSWREDQYVAAALVGPGHVAGLTGKSRVCWLRAGMLGLTQYRQPEGVLGPVRAVACFPSHPTRELIVVGADGTVARLPVPS